MGSTSRGRSEATPGANLFFLVSKAERTFQESADHERIDNARRKQIIDLVLPMSGDDGVQCAAGQAYGSTALSLQVSTSEARRAQFRMPAS